MGPFHRRESPTQTPGDALMQVASGEIWGRTPFGGMAPTVQAYAGSIVGRGIEFTTDIVPRVGSSPFEARWYLGLTLGVELRTKGGVEYACILANVANYQP